MEYVKLKKKQFSDKQEISYVIHLPNIRNTLNSKTLSPSCKKLVTGTEKVNAKITGCNTDVVP